MIQLVESIPIFSYNWIDFFNLPEFYNLNKNKNSQYISFYEDDTLIAVCHFSLNYNNVYKSPVRGTFGGISIKENINTERINLIVNLFSTYLEKNGFLPFELISKPFKHNYSEQSILMNAFVKNGFQVSTTEINHSLNISDNQFIHGLKRNNFKRLNKCIKENFLFKIVEDDNEIFEVYKIIEMNRLSKGYNISMSFKQIAISKKEFVNRYLFFGVKNGENNFIASSICLKLNDNILYVFYWGDLQEYSEYSPIVFLAQGIYNYCLNNNYKVLDVGVSTLNGDPNFGLIKFKEGLGCESSIKISYKKYE
jgi:hypothetical protein